MSEDTKPPIATELFERAVSEMAEEHQRGMDAMDGVIGKKTPGLIALHKFTAGATFARQWVLANDPVVRGMADLARHTQDCLEFAPRDCDGDISECRCGYTKALAAYRAACGEGEGDE